MHGIHIWRQHSDTRFMGFFKIIIYSFGFFFSFFSASYFSNAETTPSLYIESSTHRFYDTSTHLYFDSSLPTGISVNCCICANKTSAVTSVDQIQEELKIDKTSLSSFKRTKTSAEDDRESSRFIGLVGSLIIAMVLIIIVSMDIVELLKLYSNSKYAYRA